jgi:hypothetical protein
MRAGDCNLVASSVSLVSKKDLFITQLVSNKITCFCLSSSLVAAAAAAAEGFPVFVFFFFPCNF